MGETLLENKDSGSAFGYAEYNYCSFEGKWFPKSEVIKNSSGQICCRSCGHLLRLKPRQCITSKANREKNRRRARRLRFLTIAVEQLQKKSKLDDADKVTRAQLLAVLNRIEERLVEIERQLSTWKPQAQIVSSDVLESVLLKLPDHLRKTYLAVDGLGEAYATDISAATGKARAQESTYLNQLTLLGYLERQRRGRKTFFRLTQAVVTAK